MEYKLGVLDKYPIAARGTEIEEVPHITVEIDETVDEKKLRQALCGALESFPIFKTKFVFEKEYKLVENPAEFEIYNVSEEALPKYYGKSTNEYPWRLSYWENTVTFEWCHGISDGKGGAAFFSDIINRYFGGHVDLPLCIKPGIDCFYDPKEKGIPQKKQLPAFGRSALKIDKDLEMANLHIIRTDMKNIMSIAKRSDASPATVIPPLFSRALRECMPVKKPVKASIVIDVRNTMKHFTMQNCIITKEITYIDKFDGMPMELVSTIYRSILDIAVQKENIVKDSTELVKLLGMLVNIKSRVLLEMLIKPVAKIAKNTMSDFTLTYLGKVAFTPEAGAHIKDVRAHSWCDMGYSNICAYDLNGEFVLNIVENYSDKTIIPKFIEILKEYGAEATETENRMIKRTRIKL